MQLHKECLELAKALLNCYCIHGNIREEAVLVVQHPTASGFEAKLLLGDYSQAQYANPDGRAMVPIPCKLRMSMHQHRTCLTGFPKGC